MRVVSKVAMYDLGVRGKTDAAAKSLQSCPTLCNPMDWSLSGFSVHGILQARTLEWVAISFSNAWKWKVKVKLLSRVRLLAIPWTAAYLAPPFMGLSRQQYRSGVPLPSPEVRLEESKAIRRCVRFWHQFWWVPHPHTHTLLLLLSHFSRVRLCATP